jgi:hypothetical protein
MVDKWAWDRLRANARKNVFNKVNAAGGYIQVVDDLAESR